MFVGLRSCEMCSCQIEPYVRPLSFKCVCVRVCFSEKIDVHKFRLALILKVLGWMFFGNKFFETRAYCTKSRKR